MLSDKELEQLVTGYIAYWSNIHLSNKNNISIKRKRSDTESVMDRIYDLEYDCPEDLWEFILEVLHRDPPNKVIEVLAAGSLESYLAKLGEKVIEKAERQAAIDKKFRSLLGGVWQNNMSDEVWNRIRACSDRSFWDRGI